MDEHEVDFSCDQTVFQSCQPLQLWLIIDRQFVVFAHWWHLVVLHMPDTGLAEPQVLITVNHDSYTRDRGIPKTVLDDVTVWSSMCVVHPSLKIL